MTTERCCANCFGDGHLRRVVIPKESSAIGTCNYCRAEEVELVEPNRLSSWFNVVSAIYMPATPGRLLREWLSEDWAMFPSLPPSRADDLLRSILLDDPQILCRMLAPPRSSLDDALGRWSDFKMQLMYRSRFFPAGGLDKPMLELAFQYLSVAPEDLGDTWYRARVQRGRAYHPDEMGAPSKGMASNGRANPAGIPYLYLASDPLTAIAEVRPHPGQLVDVGEFRLPHNLYIVDLKVPRATISPFQVPEDAVATIRDSIGFLEQLGKELSRPVVPDAAAVDYTPTQYLCEFVKHCGHDGVRYGSSMCRNGENLALFDTQLRATRVDSYEIVTMDVNAVALRPTAG